VLTLNDTGRDDWLIVNPKARGYFRTIYDDRNWDLITEQLLKDHTVISNKFHGGVSSSNP
jgi:hypothetical protein